MADFEREIDIENLWSIILQETQREAVNSPLLAAFLQRNIITHQSFEQALCYILAEKLADDKAQISRWQQSFCEIVNRENVAISQAALADLLCQLRANASIKDHYSPLLFFGGYQALQCYRFAHYCWHHEQRALASYIQGKCVTLFGVDIHPGAKIGQGIFLDHSVAVVIGETAVVEDDVTIFQSVTLGGTGKGSGDRHPKVRQGAFIGSGSVVYGNIEIGKNAKVAGGTVVVKDVAPNTTVLGPVAIRKAK